MCTGILLKISLLERFLDCSIGMKSCSTCGFKSIIRIIYIYYSCFLKDFIVILHWCRGLRGNMLTGTLSPDICQLTGLWYLWVVLPSQSDVVPVLTCCLTSFLTFVIRFYFAWIHSDVRGNNLTGTIPESIGNCTSFEILYVKHLVLIE